VYNNYSDIKNISHLRKNNSPLHPPMWKKEATSYYFFFIKITMAKRPRSRNYASEVQRSSMIASLLVENQLKIPTGSSTIITPFTILIMVSRRTSAELDVADPPENT